MILAYAIAGMLALAITFLALSYAKEALEAGRDRTAYNQYLDMRASSRDRGCGPGSNPPNFTTYIEKQKFFDDELTRTQQTKRGCR